MRIIKTLILFRLKSFVFTENILERFIMKAEKPRRLTAENINRIPDYEYLFKEEVDKRGKSKSHFLRKIIKMNIWSLILSSIVYLLEASPVWAMPIISSNVINIATNAIAEGTGVSAEVWRQVAINALVLAVLILQNVPSTMLVWKINSLMLRRTSAGIKGSVVRKLQSLSITYHKDIETGKLQSKFLKDTVEVDNFFRLIVFSFIQGLINAVVSIGIAIYRNWLISLFFLLVIPVNVGLTFLFRRKVSIVNHDFRKENENVSVKLTNMLTMMPVTKAHGLERTEISSVEKSIAQLTGSGIIMDKAYGKFGACSWVTNTLLSAVCLIFCVVLALIGKIQVGDVVLYQSLFSTISSSVSGLIGLFPQLSTGMEALSSVSEIMNAKDVEMNSGKKGIPDINGCVCFDNVSYKYPDADELVVKNFNLDVKSGECIAVVGASGSGKSTIMNLIIGFLVPTEGQVLIDGKSLTELNLSEYRHHLSVVPQNSILFSGTIRENITYGLGNYTEEQLNEVIEKANLKEFVDKLPKGLDTRIGENGDKLSGGQKQRITIARALIRNPRILILDEATSALDNISEYHVQKAISSSIKGRTTFIVAHRLSTIRDADRIVVMERGVAVEIGTYEELMAKRGKFYELKCLNEINLKQAEEGLS